MFQTGVDIEENYEKGICIGRLGPVCHLQVRQTDQVWYPPG